MTTAPNEIIVKHIHITNLCSNSSTVKIILKNEVRSVWHSVNFSLCSLDKKYKTKKMDSYALRFVLQYVDIKYIINN